MMSVIFSLFVYMYTCIIIAQVSSDVVCPDGAALCSDENTCCQLSTGDYACCPLSKATCCSDNSHCCPQGYTCNATASTCTSGTKVLDWLEMTRRRTSSLEDIVCKDNSHCPVGRFCCRLESGRNGCCPSLSGVTCPGGVAFCPYGTKCCENPTGGYGCCPFTFGTCCSDGLHCCPEGYNCDISGTFCFRGRGIVGWLPNLKATPVNATDV